MHAIGGKGPQRLAKGIERAGADIAIDDADRADDQPDKALPAGAIPVLSICVDVMVPRSCHLPMSTNICRIAERQAN